MVAVVVFRLPLDRPNGRPVEVAAAALDRTSALIWVDVDLAAGPAEIEARLAELGLPGLDREAVEDLRRADVLGAAGADRRLTTADLTASHGADTAVQLSVRPLALIAGAGWVLTARGPALAEGGGEPDELAHEALLRRLERRWHPWPSAASDDLATAVLLETVSAWPAVLGTLAARQAELERSYLDAHGLDVSERTDASATLQADLALLRRQTLAVDREVRRLARPGRDPVSAWFRAHGTENEALQIPAVLDSCRAELGTLLEAQRATLQLIASRAAVDQLLIADLAAQRGQAVQQLVAWLTGVLLVPTLVATVFGALPGILEQCAAGRAMVVVGATLLTMAVGAATAWKLVGPPRIQPAQRAHTSR
jgi:hypothetical protein